LVELVVGLAGIIVGTAIGAVVTHLFATRRGVSEARRRVLSEEVNKLYAPIEQLVVSTPVEI
jgi:gas vesicle protein